MDTSKVVFNIKKNNIFCDNFLFKNSFIKDFLLIKNDNDLKKKTQVTNNDERR